jgi:hypothetical protein
MLAQDSSTRSVSSVDINGNRLPAAMYSTVGGQRVETTRSINGRVVPLESSEDRLIRQDANSRVIERVVRRHDATGNAGAADLVRIEERKNPDGSTTMQAVTYRADLNGNKQPVERVTTETRKRGLTTESATTVERGSGGGLQLFEKTQLVERESGRGAQSESTTYRRDVNGNLFTAAKEVKVVDRSGGTEKSDTARYEPGTTGSMELKERTIGRIRTNSDGSQVEEVDVYARQMATNAGDADASASPRLQQRIVKQRSAPGPGNVVVEKTSVQARLPNDPARLGNYEEITKVIRTTTDASGKEVTNVETQVGRRDPNGQVRVTEVSSEQGVAAKTQGK